MLLDQGSADDPGSIIRKFGSLDQFTTELRLRLLLRPMSYAADLQALRNRGGDPEQYSFEEVRQHVEAAPGQVACVVGGPGEGKSTLAAMMSPTESDGVRPLSRQPTFASAPTRTARTSARSLAPSAIRSRSMWTTPTR